MRATLPQGARMGHIQNTANSAIDRALWSGRARLCTRFKSRNQYSAFLWHWPLRCSWERANLHVLLLTAQKAWGCEFGGRGTVHITTRPSVQRHRPLPALAGEMSAHASPPGLPHATATNLLTLTARLWEGETRACSRKTWPPSLTPGPSLPRRPPRSRRRPPSRRRDPGARWAPLPPAASRAPRAPPPPGP